MFSECDKKDVPVLLYVPIKKMSEERLNVKAEVNDIDHTYNELLLFKWYYGKYCEGKPVKFSCSRCQHF